MNKGINILVTNDDGIEAEGINTLVKALSSHGNVYVCAPDTQKSACGHGISIHTPIVVKEWGMEGAIRAYRITGTPADCVKLATKKLFRDMGVKFDIVFSGINHGANLGTDTLYSGTVAGAIEGLLCGYASVAVSVAGFSDLKFEAAANVAGQICEKYKEKGLEKNTILNVNSPNKKLEDIKGVMVTSLGVMKYNEEFERRTSPFGTEYYWYGGNLIKTEAPEHHDIHAIRMGYIAVTPLHFDLTDEKRVEEIKEWNLKI